MPDFARRNNAACDQKSKAPKGASFRGSGGESRNSLPTRQLSEWVTDIATPGGADTIDRPIKLRHPRLLALVCRIISRLQITAPRLRI